MAQSLLHRMWSVKESFVFKKQKSLPATAETISPLRVSMNKTLTRRLAECIITAAAIMPLGLGTSSAMGVAKVAAGRPFNDSPSIMIRIELTERAKEQLVRKGESIIVVAEFADEIGPSGNYIGRARLEFLKPDLVMFGGLFTPVTSQHASTPVDYELNLNVSSGHHHRANNILDCDMFQDRISTVAQKLIVVRCDRLR